MNDAALHDAAERAAALDTSRSFIVQAPAGSGKTELLIQRYLALLARVDRPESIVAMTFTRKSAGEIRERILRALREPEPGSDAEPSRALTGRLARAALARGAASGWNLVAHPARLQIHTIDALCMALVRQAPLTAKLGALPRPIEQAQWLYLEAAREECFAAGPSDDAWRRLLDHLDNDAERAVQLIATLLGKREQWLRCLVTDAPELRTLLEQALAAEIGAELRALEAHLPQRLLASLLELAQHAGGNLAASGSAHPLAALASVKGFPPATSEGLAHWQAIAGWLLTRDGKLRVAVDARQGFPPAGRARKRAMVKLIEELARVPGLVKALNVVCTLPPPRYDDAAWSFIEALLVVLPRAAARLRLVFARHGVIDFHEATLVALGALQTDGGGPSDLLLALDARIEHLLVDEFQ